ncbi:MAG: Ltp family lipoprotein [Corynebacterium casei]|nr:Ltp family lipoprotein [Corynebacterium casei]
MKVSVPTPDNGAGRSTANGRIFGLKKSTLSLITALAVGTPLLIACDSADAIPVNTEVISTPAVTTTEQTPAPTTTSKAPKPEPTSSRETTTSAQPAPSTTSAKPDEPTEETTSAAPTTTSKAPKPKVTSTSKASAPSTTSTKSSEPTETTEEPEPTKPAEPVEEIPSDYRAALGSAKYFLANDQGTSYQYIYDIMIMDAGIVHSPEATKYALDSLDIDWNQRAVNKVRSYTSEGGRSYSVTLYQLTERVDFTEEQALFALENVDIDWNAEALEQAQERIDGNNGVSKTALFSWLTSESSTAKLIGAGGFSDDEAFYAVNNVDVDWNEEAVKEVNAKLETFSPISRERLYFMLSPSFTSQGFTRPQLDYAFAQFPENTWKEQAVREARVYTLNNDPSRAELINFLVNGEKYTREEAEYAADTLGL